MALVLLTVPDEIKESYDNHFIEIKKAAHLVNMAVCQNIFECDGVKHYILPEKDMKYSFLYGFDELEHGGFDDEYEQKMKRPYERLTNQMKGLTNLDTNLVVTIKKSKMIYLGSYGEKNFCFMI
ncbi:hypothetical protein [Photobacterium leiognathi]|uniref:hypothetical protein n=1 Tax=Photobacterium leiognathi TaxID=553611 RepID=UPI0027399A74|nr:hypothetical protein [Photobacterium leiognathi]